MGGICGQIHLFYVGIFDKGRWTAGSVTGQAAFGVTGIPGAGLDAERGFIDGRFFCRSTEDSAQSTQVCLSGSSPVTFRPNTVATGWGLRQGFRRQDHGGVSHLRWRDIENGDSKDADISHDLSPARPVRLWHFQGFLS
jgi:hypothetical protein